MDVTQEAEQYKQALITSLRLLSASPKSGTELRKKLVSKGFADAIVTRALKELAEQGVLDDSAYAKDLVARLTQSGAAGKNRVAFELKRRGVPQAIRDELLGSMTPEDERARALEQARLKWAGWGNLEPRKREKRLYDLLIRKGYDFQVAQDVLMRLDKEPPGDGM